MSSNCSSPSASNQSLCTKETLAPSLAALAIATHSASRERSSATTSGASSSSASVTASAPLPVPMSSTRRPRRPGEVGERELDQQLGLRARDQHRRGDEELAAVELARAGEIGHRLAGGAALDQGAVFCPVLAGELLLRPRHQARRRALQHVAQQHARVHLVDVRARPGERAGDVELAGGRLALRDSSVVRQRREQARPGARA
jgi:hypothetical protein